MSRSIKIALLSVIALFAILAAGFCVLLIQNYRWQFDMKMTYAEMTRHVRNASLALGTFVFTAVFALYRLIRLVRSSSASITGPPESA